MGGISVMKISRAQLSLFSRDSFPEYVYPVTLPIRLNANVGDWCRLPYAGHPRGCPGYGEKAGCPPNAPSLVHFFNPGLPFYLIHSEFDLEEHAANMKVKHPEWTDAQCRCVLYWQSRSRKQLLERILESVPAGKRVIYSICPEGMGVNVFLTARLSGLRLEKTRHLRTCRHVALAQFY
jgi:hypothetical protein